MKSLNDNGDVSRAIIFKYKMQKWKGFVWFNGISTFVGYLMPTPFS